MDKLSSPTSLSDDIPCILPFVAKASMTKISGTWYRIQLPLSPAHASTVHKAQGCTALYGMVASPSEGRIFARGLEYVMMSRPTKIEDVFLLNELRPEHFNGFGALRLLIFREYERLRFQFPA